MVTTSRMGRAGKARAVELSSRSAATALQHGQSRHHHRHWRLQHYRDADRQTPIADLRACSPDECCRRVAELTRGPVHIVVGVLHSNAPHDDHCACDGRCSIDNNGDADSASDSASGAVDGEGESRVHHVMSGPHSAVDQRVGPCRWAPLQLPLTVLASIVSAPDDATARVALAVRTAFNKLKCATGGVDVAASRSCSGGARSPRAHVFVIVPQWWTTHQALAWSRVLGGYESRVSRLRVATLWFSTLGGAYSALGDVKPSHASRALEMAVAQLRLASALGDDGLAARCRVYIAWSRAQMGDLEGAAAMVAKEEQRASSTGRRPDPQVLLICSAAREKIRRKRRDRNSRITRSTSGAASKHDETTSSASHEQQ